MISNDVNFEPYRAHFQRSGRVQILGFLQAEAAEQLHVCLRDAVPWTLAERTEGKARTIAADVYTQMSASEREALYQKAYAQARQSFQFVYDAYMLVRARLEGRDPDLAVHVVLEFFNSPEAIAFFRWLTGVPDIVGANGQATRFLPGQFLTRHEDEDRTENRAAAYVINLSRNWDPDWGGLLQFHGADGGIEQTLMPRFNSISMFRVPQPHSVSLVAPWAGEPRLAITGWLLRAKSGV